MLNENPKPQEEYKLSFWQHPFIQNTLPFITSLVLHLSLIALGLATMQVVKIVVYDPNQKLDALLGDPEPPTDPNSNPLTLPPGFDHEDRPAAQNTILAVPLAKTGFNDHMGRIPKALLPGGGSSDAEPTELTRMIIGPGASAGSGQGGIGSGHGPGVGGGEGDGLPAPFGVPSRGGAPDGSIFRLPPARRVAYVCDASGSMLNMFGSLRAEIRKSVDSLRPNQSFNLYFFQAQGVKVVDPAALMPAIPSNKQKAFDFMDKMYAANETNPIPALDLAFKHGADFIYLLTDGDFNGPGNDAVVKYCAERTKDGKKRISTIAYIGKESKDSQQDAEFVKALKAIAKDSGGSFRFVTDDDMGE
ncbi:MAG: hypothetical protein ABSH20_10385 [Tepidisphaeraceae bacterium]|jgi:hypothetical protein